MNKLNELVEILIQKTENDDILWTNNDLYNEYVSNDIIIKRRTLGYFLLRGDLTIPIKEPVKLVVAIKNNIKRQNNKRIKSLIEELK